MTNGSNPPELPTGDTENNTQIVSHRVPSKFARRVLGIRKRLEGTEEKLEETARERDRALDEAGRDSLTGLPNRRFYKAALERMVNQGEPFGMLMVDLDLFKAVNDRHGHEAGDLVLKATASRIIEIVGMNIQNLTRHEEEHGKEDVVARWGGEEIAILLPEVTKTQDLSNIAERIRLALSENAFVLQVGILRKKIPITASIGGSIWRPGDNIDATTAIVDTNLYSAKKAGRNRTVIV